MTMTTSTDASLAWYNFVTDEYDFLVGLPLTDEQAEQYLPQPWGVNLYRLLRQHEGLSILEAMKRVLLASVGSHDNCD